jgi:hypothetical protein
MRRERRCESCGRTIDFCVPYVMMDITGREGPVADPVHIECYVAGCDVDLSSNDEIVGAIVEHAPRFIEAVHGE